MADQWQYCDIVGPPLPCRRACRGGGKNSRQLRTRIIHASARAADGCRGLSRQPPSPLRRVCRQNRLPGLPLTPVSSSARECLAIRGQIQRCNCASGWRARHLQGLSTLPRDPVRERVRRRDVRRRAQRRGARYHPGSLVVRGALFARQHPAEARRCGAC